MVPQDGADLSMAFTLEPWPDTGILVVTGIGAGSVEESDEVLVALTRQRLVPRIQGVLFDLRRLDYVPTADEARRISAGYARFGVEQQCRMAYVAPPGAQYGIARMVEMLTTQHGVAAATFTLFDLALRWLQEDARALGA